jgi:hypothetical protein
MCVNVGAPTEYEAMFHVPTSTDSTGGSSANSVGKADSEADGPAAPARADRSFRIAMRNARQQRSRAWMEWKRNSCMTRPSYKKYG